MEKFKINILHKFLVGGIEKSTILLLVFFFYRKTVTQICGIENNNSLSLLSFDFSTSSLIFSSYFFYKYFKYIFSLST